MESQRERERIGKRVRDLIRLEQRRHLRFAARAAQPFRDVEDQIPSLAARHAHRQGADVADAVGFVPDRGQRLLERVNRVDAVELGGLVLAEPLREVRVAEVVRHSYSHRFAASG